MWKRPLTNLPLLGASVALLCAAPAHAGNVVFDITYVDAVQETSPNVASYTVNQHVTVTLHDGNQVTEQRTWQAPKSGSSIGVSGALGANVSAKKFTIKWRVESQNLLIRYREFPQHVEILRLAVSGQTCQATIEHKLKPGFTTYERFGSGWEPHDYSSLQSTGIECRVSEQ